MKFRRKEDRGCNSKRCGRIVGCIICLVIAVCALLVSNMRQQGQRKVRLGALRAKQEEETLSKQQAQLEEQQAKLQEEQERQRKEDEELSEQERLEKQRLEAKQESQYQDLKEELVKAEQKIASIAKVVDGGADDLKLASANLPETLAEEDREGQIENVKTLVEEAKAKIKQLESALD